MRFPSFSLPGSDGRTHRLADYQGKPLVVYFYPKDSTSGCTAEACDFRDHLSALTRRGVAVLGVSPDSLESHRRFVEKQQLTFPLLVDEGHRLADALGVWAEKSLYGRTFMGIVRSTFLVGPDGEIAREWRKVKVNGHVAAVLEAVGELGKPGAASGKPAAGRARTKAAPAKRAR
jgi:peroxiredoxin Q/BCP